MQCSELYRRGVVLPLDSTALEALRLYGADSETAVEFLEIDEPLFAVLCAKGLFEMINARTGAHIDDYEEEWVEFEAADGIREAIHAFRAKFRLSDPDLLGFLTALEQLAATASRERLPLLFVL